MGGLGLPWLKIIGGVGALLLLAAIYFDVRQSGRDAERRDIGEQNDRAVSDADLASFDLDACNRARADGERVRFDFDAGRCVRVESRR